jgi:hypothetical protein
MDAPIRTLRELVDVVQALIDSTGKHVYAEDLQAALHRVRDGTVDLTEGWALRSDSLKSRAMHYFREGRSICARQWPQQAVTLHPTPHGIACPECTRRSRETPS